jgi:hypothetical protein
MRRIRLITGLLTLAVVWLGPLPQLAFYAFAAHMTMPIGVVAVAAPLLGGLWLTAGLLKGRTFKPEPHA